MLVINICEKKQCRQKAFHHKTSFRSALSRQILQCWNSHFPKKINSHLCFLLSTLCSGSGIDLTSPYNSCHIESPIFLPPDLFLSPQFPISENPNFFWVSDSSFEIPCSSLPVCSSFGGGGGGGGRSRFLDRQASVVLTRTVDGDGDGDLRFAPLRHTPTATATATTSVVGFPPLLCKL